MKKTNTFKRFAAITSASILAACMVAPMAMTSNAANEKSNITISGAATGSEYCGYQLMTLTQDGSAYSYTINPTYSTILRAAAGNVATDNAVIEFLESANATEVRDFADKVYKAILADTTSAYTYIQLSAVEATQVDQGYYLVVETKTGSSSPDDTYSLAMLDTAGDNNVTITTKESTPTLVKKIKDITDKDGNVTGWQDSADYDIGDNIPFQLTGTVSSKYDDYEEYYYAFHDTLSPGLTFNDDVKVYVGEAEITSGYTVVTEGITDGCSFHVVFDDLKKISSVTSASSIVVEYSAKLNNNAVIGKAGNPNVADLEYNVNPYFTDVDNDGKDDTTNEDEETGYTPEDKVIAFTYKVIVNKVDPDGAPLNGATFKLEKNIEGSWTELAIVESTDGTTFTFTGLDDGEYRLTETEAPEGYNKLTDAIEFTVTADHEIASDDPQLISLTGGDVFTGDVDTCTLTANIKNETGNQLPSTGGIGTKLFYLGGGAMVAVAGVYLISKKRMKNAE
ncbi:MAG: isopeptide-forming domain-containing fimbrial protein [Ruminococcus sp.]|nr:isopeptide-forming domain-containing fimbrial protein [Ruminococcus sp.]